MKRRLIVGSSTAIRTIASGFSRSEIVSPISNSSIPLIAQISPARTESTFSLAKPVKTKSSLALIFLTPEAVQRA